MTSRYTIRELITNNNKMYKEHFKKRGVTYMRQYDTPVMKYPTLKQINEIGTVSHIWKTGDRFYKLAQYHYGDSQFWWVIAWFNKAPTEAHVEFGDIVLIPENLEIFLSIAYDTVE